MNTQGADTYFIIAIVLAVRLRAVDEPLKFARVPAPTAIACAPAPCATAAVAPIALTAVRGCGLVALLNGRPLFRSLPRQCETCCETRDDAPVAGSRAGETRRPRSSSLRSVAQTKPVHSPPAQAGLAPCATRCTQGGFSRALREPTEPVRGRRCSPTCAQTGSRSTKQGNKPLVLLQHNVEALSAVCGGDLWTTFATHAAHRESYLVHVQRVAGGDILGQGRERDLACACALNFCSVLRGHQDAPERHVQP